MSERTMEKARQVVHRLSEWYFAEGGDNDPDSPIDREDLDALHDLVRTPRGEGEAAAMSANLARALAAMQAAWIEWRRGRGADAAMQWIENTLIGPGLIPGDDASDAQAFFDRAIAEIENHQIRHAAALRSDAQGEEDVGEFCDLCGEMFDPSELGTVIGPLGQDDGVPRWYRCPRCARAYDAGYQQGQRDPRGDETADPTALRSDAQGEDLWEDLVFGPITEAYNEAHAAHSSDRSDDDASM